MNINFICTKTRECRANNFLGMSYGPAYDGIDFSKSVANRQNGHVVAGVDDLVGDMLVIFHEWQDGINAAFWRLKAVYFDQGIVTPSDIYNKWSGDKTGQKGLEIAKIMGVLPTQKLIWGSNDLIDLIHAMLRFEDSTAIFESDLINIPIEMYHIAIAYADKKTEAVPEPVTVGNKKTEVVMPDVPQPAPSVPFYKTPEGLKDIGTLLGIAGDVFNYFSPHIPPGLSTLIGLALRAGINLTTGGNPQ